MFSNNNNRMQSPDENPFRELEIALSDELELMQEIARMNEISRSW